MPAETRVETGRAVAPDMSGEVEYETRRLAELPPSVVTASGTDAVVEPMAGTATLKYGVSGAFVE